MDRQIITDYSPLEFLSEDSMFDGKTPDEVILELEALKEKYAGRDIFFKRDYYSYGGASEVQLIERRLENDGEFRARIRNEERKAKEAARDAQKQEAKELALYKKLKKKFEKSNTGG